MNDKNILVFISKCYEKLKENGVNENDITLLNMWYDENNFRCSYLDTNNNLLYLCILILESNTLYIKKFKYVKEMCKEEYR